MERYFPLTVWTREPWKDFAQPTELIGGSLLLSCIQKDAEKI